MVGSGLGVGSGMEARCLGCPCACCPWMSSPSPRNLNDFHVRRRNEIPDVPPPRLERRAPFLKILKPVVDGCNAADRAAHVVEHLVDDMRWEVQPCHPS